MVLTASAIVLFRETPLLYTVHRTVRCVWTGFNVGSYKLINVRACRPIARQRLLCRSRLFKFIDFGTNRKPVCDFLLVDNAKLHPISHRSPVLALRCNVKLSLSLGALLFRLLHVTNETLRSETERRPKPSVFLRDETETETFPDLRAETETFRNSVSRPRLRDRDVMPDSLSASLRIAISHSQKVDSLSSLFYCIQYGSSFS